MGILVFWLVFPGTYELAVLLLALPALAGAAPEPAVRSAVAIWAVAILLALGVRAPDDDAPAGKPVPAEE